MILDRNLLFSWNDNDPGGAHGGAFKSIWNFEDVHDDQDTLDLVYDTHNGIMVRKDTIDPVPLGAQNQLLGIGYPTFFAYVAEDLNMSLAVSFYEDDDVVISNGNKVAEGPTLGNAQVDGPASGVTMLRFAAPSIGKRFIGVNLSGQAPANGGDGGTGTAVGGIVCGMFLSVQEGFAQIPRP